MKKIWILTQYLCRAVGTFVRRRTLLCASGVSKTLLSLSQALRYAIRNNLQGTGKAKCRRALLYLSQALHSTIRNK